MSTMPRVVVVAALACAPWLIDAWPAVSGAEPESHPKALFQTADTCLTCHTGMVTPAGEDVSFGPQWRASMMANSARDPYWQAGVRREIADHPQARGLIEDECSICHMPMARFESTLAGHEGLIFAHLPAGGVDTPAAVLAADGVSCTACHQITAEKLGTRASFTGGFQIDTATPVEQRRILGPFDVDPGRTRIMRSASSFVPARASHLAESEVCATCHTLITQAFGPDGKVTGELPEQVPYQEWQHSAYRETQSCQACHMPVVAEPMPMTPVWGEPREGVSRHAFRGGNSFMTRLLTRYAGELGVVALPQELEGASARTISHLETETARLSIVRAEVSGGRLLADVAVENLAGHKLPTAYPSRRAWLHVTVRDRHGAVVFESGGVAPSGTIAGNDNDEDGARFEPHYAEIDRPDQVQVYESVMADPQGAVTTGLLTAVKYVKDNRLLPRGFDKATAPADVAVHGDAASDADFTAGGDRVRYSVALPGDAGPYRVDAELRYQTIGYRWAENLRRYDAFETQRFVRYYDAMSAGSAVRLAAASVQVR
jgi:cytochrome c551/c552